MKELVEYLVHSLVDYPEQVTLSIEEEDDNVTMRLTVAQEDLGKVIGKSGTTINAMRTVVQAAASSRGKRVRLDIGG
ncbi:MAG: KH domain-containing protein [Syntrophobacteraceae bacterium]